MIFNHGTKYYVDKSSAINWHKKEHPGFAEHSESIVEHGIKEGIIIVGKIPTFTQTVRNGRYMTIPPKIVLPKQETF